MELAPHQIRAKSKLKNGSILYADVGTGKSRTALAYFYETVCGGSMEINGEGSWGEPTSPLDLFIITTAKKRDSLDWEKECVPFGISSGENSIGGIKLTVDSWNNIKKYQNVTGAFFIFDEQRVTGKGPWVDAFLKIAKHNKWILLSATPGDKWKDYIPVFIANGFYRTKTEFYQRHCILNPFVSYIDVKSYRNVGELMKHRSEILVKMPYRKRAETITTDIHVQYDRLTYKRVYKERWNPFDNCPIDDMGSLMFILRKVVNSHPSRVSETVDVVLRHRKVIIFYNYNFELEMLKAAFKMIDGLDVAEWNGSRHEQVPESDFWVYLVQYMSGAEGWNCITADTMLFYSQSYSFKMTVQATGRINRMNTGYETLYYYYLKSSAPIDIAIAQALKEKRDFNESEFLSPFVRH